jgi:hypothetical protein
VTTVARDLPAALQIDIVGCGAYSGHSETPRWRNW